MKKIKHLILNFWPQRPSAHGVLRLILELYVEQFNKKLNAKTCVLFVVDNSFIYKPLFLSNSDSNNTNYSFSEEHLLRSVSFIMNSILTFLYSCGNIRAGIRKCSNVLGNMILTAETFYFTLHSTYSTCEI